MKNDWFSLWSMGEVPPELGFYKESRTFFCWWILVKSLEKWNSLKDLVSSLVLELNLLGKLLRKYMEWWISAWTQEDLRKVSLILTHLAVFLCHQINCQIGVIKVITNICLIHSTVITQWRSFCSMIYNFHNNPGEEMIWYYGYFTDRKTITG